MDIYRDAPASTRPRIILNNTTPFTPSLIKGRLSAASNPEQIYANRIKGRQILLENPPRASKSKQEADEKKRARKLTAGKVKKQWAPFAGDNGLWKLKDSEAKYSLFLPLHHLWMGYMSELLALHPPGSSSIHAMPNAAAMHAKLVKADFHGSIITVRQSKNPCLIGVSGIIIYESENAFRVITKGDKLKLVPKGNSIFVFAVPLHSTLTASESSSASSPTASEMVTDRAHMEFELHGNQFRFRSTDRASRKFKHKETVEL